MTAAFFKDELSNGTCLESEHWVEKTTVEFSSLNSISVPLIESRIKNSDAKFEQRIEIQPNKKKLTREFQSKAKEHICLSGEDANLKAFYDSIKETKSVVHKKNE
jgi:hypothetical protein